MHFFCDKNLFTSDIHSDLLLISKKITKNMKKYYVISVLSIIAMTNYGVIPPWFNAGIYCNDTSITFKNQGDTVPTLYLFGGMFIPTFIVVSFF